MNKKSGWISLAIACVALILSVYNLVSRPASSVPVPETSETAEASGTSEASDTSEQDGKDIQYVMYLGTNDKDTNEPVFDHDQAKEKLDEVLTKHFEGFTIQEANGGWTNEDGTVSHEYTLVIHLSDTSIKKVREAADDLLEAFHQSSVLIQANKTTTEFYSGE